MESKMDYAQLSVINTSIDELYIPLLGKHTTNPEEEAFDLAEKIKEFFVFNDSNPSDPRVMLLMGDTGSGKSVFTQQLFHQLWQSRKENDPIPLWIPLPELLNPFEGAVEEVLKKYEFSESQIAEMKVREKFIFIVDSYDELHQFQNCYVTNQWDRWAAKVLITCRSQALYYQTDYEKYFMPFQGEQRMPLLLRKLYVAAFSEEQIRSYVKQYQQLNSEIKILEDDFTKVPGLTELIKTPFLLHLAVEVLPDILASQVDDEKITQAKLYDVFIERWFTRQVKKLRAAGLIKESEQYTKQQFWNYCKKLAQQMHEIEITVIPYQGKKVGGRLFGKPAQTTSWASFFSEETEMVRSACPIRRYGEHHYGFVHASMVEYFATRAMYEEITQEDEFTGHHSLIASEAQQSSEMIDFSGSLRVARDDGPQKNNQPRGGIHQRLFSLERQSIQFLADRIEMSEAFQQKMLAILEASKKSEGYAIGAANAITALVRACVTFNGANLSGIRIPGADISRGFFDSADLSGADLRHTRMRNIWLREASLQGSQFEGVNFGEYPRFMQEGIVYCFDFREDLKLLVKSNDKDIMLCDTVTGEQLKLLRGHEDNVSSVKFSPNGKWVVSGSEDKSIRIWGVSIGEAVRFLIGHEDKITSIAISPNGKHIVSSSNDKTIRLWHMAKNVALTVLQGHEEAVTSVAYSPDGKRVVSGSEDKTVRIWDIDSSKVVMVLHGHKMGVKCVAYSPHGKYIASCGNDGMVRVWEAANEKSIAKLCHNYLVDSVAFSPQSDRVVSGSTDGAVRILEIETQKELACLRGHTHGVNCVQFSANGQRVMSGSEDKTVRVWDIPKEPFIVRSRVDYRCNCLKQSPDGRWVVLGNFDGTVRICERQDWTEHVVFRGHIGEVQCVQFSPDGQQVVSGALDHFVRIWDVERRQEIFLLEGHTNYVKCVQYDPKGTCVASGSWDGTVRLWSAMTGKALAELRGHHEEVCSVEFSKDGKRILSQSSDETVRLWEVSTGKLLTLFEGYDSVQAVFCPNEEEVAVVGIATITIVNVKSKQKICLLEIGKTDFISNIQFVGDDMRVIASGLGSAVQIWDITQRKCLHRQRFHTRIQDYSYHKNGVLVISFVDGSTECWQMMGYGDDYGWKFNWSTNIDSPNLFVDGLVILEVKGLSDQNCRLLEQCGALTKPPPLKHVETTQIEIQELREPPQQEAVQKQRKGDVIQRVSSARTKWGSTKRTGSPIHQNNNNETKSDNTEDEEKARRCVIA